MLLISCSTFAVPVVFYQPRAQLRFFHHIVPLFSACCFCRLPPLIPLGYYTVRVFISICLSAE